MPVSSTTHTSEWSRNRITLPYVSPACRRKAVTKRGWIRWGIRCKKLPNFPESRNHIGPAIGLSVGPPLALLFNGVPVDKGVDPDKKVRIGVLPNLFQLGVWGAVSPPPAGSGANPRRQTHFGTNVLKINSKSGPFSVASYTPNSDPINDVHWLLQRKIGSVVCGCEKNLLTSGWRPDVRHREW